MLKATGLVQRSFSAKVPPHIRRSRLTLFPLSY